MTECRQECLQLGGDIVSIHSEEENEFVTSLIRKRPAQDGRGKDGKGGKNTWIGGKYSSSQGSFYWFDQSNWDFTNWDLSQPNNKGENYQCVFMGF